MQLKQLLNRFANHALVSVNTLLNIKTAEKAREIAIAWQEWASDQSLSYGELAEYQVYFNELAEKFNLTEEFKENGII